MSPAEDSPRILALDVGDRRVGVAITDATGLLAVGLKTLTRSRRTMTAFWEALLALFERYCITTVVIGLPLESDGSEQQRAQKTRLFGELLAQKLASKQYFVQLIWQDERFTSVWAQEELQAMGVSWQAVKENRGQVDQLAAIRILQDYLQT